MVNDINPMGQLPQLIEALVARLEMALDGQAGNPTTRAPTEMLLRRLRKQAAVMRAAAAAAAGDGLTPAQAAVVAQVPTPPVNLFPVWAQSKKESK
jgi:hypothetical protein